MMIGIGVSPFFRRGGTDWAAYWKTQMKFSENTILDEMDSLTGWAKGGTGTMELNETEKYSGTGSIKLTSGEGAQVRMGKTVSWDFSADNAISFKGRFYAHTDPATTIGGVGVIFSETSNITENAFAWYLDVSLLKLNEWLEIDVRSHSCMFSGQKPIVYSGSPDWANIKYVRVYVTGKTGQVASVSFDACEHGAEYKPTALITFDDGNISDYTMAFPYLRSRGMVATSYIISSYVGETYLSDVHKLTLNNGGWDIANHTDDHTDLSTLATEEDVMAHLTACETHLNNIGLSRTSKHIAYPFGNINETVLAAMATWGALTGRCTGGGYSGTMTYMYNYPHQISAAGSDVATAKTLIDHVNHHKTNVVFIFHSLADPEDYAGFCEIVDYIESKNMQTLTISEFYRLATEDITVYHK